MLNKKGLLKNLASLGIIQIANFVMPLISVPIISRIIGPEKFGSINYVGAIIIYFNIFIGYGFNLTATRKISHDSNNTLLRNKTFSEVLSCQVILFVLSAILYSFCIYKIPLLASDKRMALFAFLFCISSVLTQNWFFQVMQNMSKVATLNVLAKFIYLFFVLLLIKKEQDYYYQPLVLSITQIIISALSFIWAIKNYNIQFIYVPIKDCIKLLWVEKTVFFSIMFSTLYTTVNIIILGLFQNQEQVGYYTAGQRLISVAQLVITLPLTQVFYPLIGRAFGESKDKGIETIQKLVPITIIFAGVLYLFMLFMGSPVLKLFYGPAFSPAIPIFKILAVIPLLVSINNVLGIQLMLNLKMDKIYFKLTGIVAIFSITLNAIFASRWGYVGSAINWVITEFLITFLLYGVLVHKKIKPFNSLYFKPAYLITSLNLKNLFKL